MVMHGPQKINDFAIVSNFNTDRNRVFLKVQVPDTGWGSVQFNKSWELLFDDLWYN